MTIFYLLIYVVIVAVYKGELVPCYMFMNIVHEIMNGPNS
jgi:hypothetical protein